MIRFLKYDITESIAIEEKKKRFISHICISLHRCRCCTVGQEEKYVSQTFLYGSFTTFGILIYNNKILDDDVMKGLPRYTLKKRHQSSPREMRTVIKI